MKKKRSKFWTVIFSLLPGAGHMFTGFMKIGFSYMAMFFGILFLSAFFNISAFLYAIPILWFYAFFDCINIRYSSEEEFAQLQDHYLLSEKQFPFLRLDFFKKRNLLIGILLALFGIYLIWNNILSFINGLLPEFDYQVIYSVTHMAPQVILGVLILILGIRLIVNKKRSGDDNA